MKSPKPEYITMLDIAAVVKDWKYNDIHDKDAIQAIETLIRQYRMNNK